MYDFKGHIAAMGSQRTFLPTLEGKPAPLTRNIWLGPGGVGVFSLKVLHSSLEPHQIFQPWKKAEENSFYGQPSGLTRLFSFLLKKKDVEIQRRKQKGTKSGRKDI